MFSQLGPLFKTMLRRAESPDTRLEIRRDDQKQQQGGGHGSHDDPESDLWQDKADVSLAAVRTYLTDRLTEMGHVFPKANDTALSPQAEAPHAQLPVRQARANRAYHAANHRHGEPPNLHDSLMNDAEATPESRHLMMLLEQTEFLARLGVETLPLETELDFLFAVERSIKKALIPYQLVGQE